MEHTTQSKMDKRRRPGSVTLLALGAMIMAGFNFLRFGQGLGNWRYLEAMLTIPPLYIVASGLFWGVLATAVGIALWFGARWAPKFTYLAALAYLVYFWLDRLLLVDPEGRGANDLFLVGVCMVIIGWMVWLFSRQKTKLYFGVNHEQQK